MLCILWVSCVFNVFVTSTVLTGFVASFAVLLYLLYEDCVLISSIVVYVLELTVLSTTF